jgi:hypothetical protein
LSLVFFSVVTALIEIIVEVAEMLRKLRTVSLLNLFHETTSL